MPSKRTDAFTIYATPLLFETLRRWHQAGVDVDRAMPQLSTYLGHIDPHSSFWYLHATPELMRPVARKLEGIQGGRS